MDASHVTTGFTLDALYRRGLKLKLGSLQTGGGIQGERPMKKFLATLSGVAIPLAATCVAYCPSAAAYPGACPFDMSTNEGKQAYSLALMKIGQETVANGIQGKSPEELSPEKQALAWKLVGESEALQANCSGPLPTVAPLPAFNPEPLAPLPSGAAPQIDDVNQLPGQGRDPLGETVKRTQAFTNCIFGAGVPAGLLGALKVGPLTKIITSYYGAPSGAVLADLLKEALEDQIGEYWAGQVVDQCNYAFG